LYFAHRTESEDKIEWQALIDHLSQVQQLSGNNASKFNAREWGEACGLLHDLGKYSQEFQLRLQGRPIAVDHSTAGAQAISNAWGKRIGTIPAYVIAGHHAGLPDHGTDSGSDSCLKKRLTRSVCPYSAAFNEITMPERPLLMPIKPAQGRNMTGLQLSLFTRMLFSCLVDADSLDTEQYCQPERMPLRQNPAKFSEMEERLHWILQERYASPRYPVDPFRNEMFQETMSHAEEEQGLFTLTMPTGAGKTLTSLAFALRHAIHHGLERIIYVIPYTSIIEQNAKEFRKVLGDEFVLEHHSNFQREPAESDENQSVTEKMELASENWDYPVIVTTNVQFFESLFSSRRSKCRKLHNIAKSVVVFDEAQMMNGGYFKPCLYTLDELSRNYGVSAILCTATQPKLQAILPKETEVKELIADVGKRFHQFKRTSVEWLGVQDLQSIADRVSQEEQILCIVNTRKTARELFELIRVGHDSGCYHLSARMCPNHRIKVLKEVRKRLADGLPCRLISTQLIEAGVDVDFPTVFRELAGLDSIAQAAGRCNRNGKLEIGSVKVFEPIDGLPSGWFSRTGAIARQVLLQHSDDPLSVEAVKTYFDELYFYQTLGNVDQMDAKSIIPLLNERVNEMALPFKQVDDLFQMIDSNMVSVIIGDKEALQLITQLQYVTHLNSTLRKLQAYTVQIYFYEFEAFREAYEVREIRKGIWVLDNIELWYDDKIGFKPYSQSHHASEVLFA
jgi:CRISPR-associated helicase Cas3/CRISPR-associated endonuclease Cas3-HD